MGTSKPPPGSDAALAAGCLCPVLDNAHGRGYLSIHGIYVYHSDCKLHRDDEAAAPCDSAGEESYE